MTAEIGKAGLVATQLAMAAAAMLVIAFAPPEKGRMLIVPLDGARIAASEIRRLNAIPLIEGPLAGSWVVDGERRWLTGLWSRGIVVLAAPAPTCTSAQG
ncbi:MAG TPA: hypothetical protein VFR36_00065 [Sphingomicrobium sp.]|nr:hypothetical protein [Sphingomicrobium sp.]